MQIFASVDSDLACPLTVSDGRMWMQEYLNLHPEVVRGTEIREAQAEETKNRKQGKNKKEKPAIEVKEVWFRYERESADVIRDLSFQVKKGEFYAVVGGNGTGKSTTLSLLCRIRAPYRGKIVLDGQDIRKFSDRELYNGYLGVLPQNPQSHFSQKDGAGRPVFSDRWQKRKNISGISDKYEERKGNRGNCQSDTSGRTS